MSETPAVSLAATHAIQSPRQVRTNDGAAREHPDFGLLLSVLIQARLDEALAHPVRDYKQRALLRRKLRDIARSGPAVVPVMLRMARNPRLRFSAHHIARNLDRSSREAIPLLIDALHINHPGVRDVASRALAKIARPVPRRLLDLLEHEDPRVREFAVTAVVGTGLYGFDTLPALRRALEDPDEHVRLWLVIDADSLRNRPLTVKLLLERLEVEDLQIQRAILGQFSNMDIRPHLYRITPFLDHGDANMRYTAVRAVAGGGKYSEGTRAVMVKALDDDDLYVRRMATYSLKRFRRAPSLRLLPRLFRNMEENHRSLAWSTADLIIHMNSAAAMPGLRALARHNNPVTRSAAKYALKKLNAKLKQSPGTAIQ